MNEMILTIYGKTHVFQDKSLKTLAKHAISILAEINDQHALKAIKMLKINRFFFRIDPDSKISCSITKL